MSTQDFNKTKDSSQHVTYKKYNEFEKKKRRQEDAPKNTTFNKVLLNGVRFRKNVNWFYHVAFEVVPETEHYDGLLRVKKEKGNHTLFFLA